MSGLAAVVAAVVALAAAVTGHLPLPTGDEPAAAAPAAPWEFTTEQWAKALGGDAGLTAARYTALTRYTDPDLTGPERVALRGLARAVAVADLTGEGRGSFPRYWPPASRTGVAPVVRCGQATVRAVSPAALPTVGDGRYAKVLVAYTGRCAEARFTGTAPGVLFVYATADRRGRWQPVRSWDVPAPAEPADDPQAATEPAPWELKEFDSCSSPGAVFRNRIMVVDAFSQMCAAAEAAGVRLSVESAYRTRGEQATLFAAAVESYGSEAEARKWVAYADAAVCTSRHCSGVAVNVRPTTAAMRWLEATVGCLTGTGVVAAASCPEGSAPVPRMARYGFAAPLPTIPGYLEFTLPAEPGQGADGSLSAPDCSPTGVPVPNLVAAIFRCRLGREGVVGPAQDTVVAQALVVSRCESGWNAAARAYAGRFATAANPVDGRTYTHTGVFMLTTELAAAGWVPGGADALDDPVANVNGAASLWLATRGWEQFGCATGTAGGFESGPVLEGYGGPPLPTWATLY